MNLCTNKETWLPRLQYAKDMMLPGLMAAAKRMGIDKYKYDLRVDEVAMTVNLNEHQIFTVHEVADGTFKSKFWDRLYPLLDAGI